MSDRPKRTFWQLHLATLVLLSLSCGFVMLKSSIQQDLHYTNTDGSVATAHTYGWPVPFIGCPADDDVPTFYYLGFNLVLWGGSLAAIITVSEWFARRKRRTSGVAGSSA